MLRKFRENKKLKRERQGHDLIGGCRLEMKIIIIAIN
jgi:hypothetical protein